MIKAHQDLERVLRRLAHGDKVNLSLNGTIILLKFFEDASKINLSTPVYHGSNYIPSSVRRGIQKPSCLDLLPTFFSVDEQNFQIHLNYFGRADELDSHQLFVIVHQFFEIALKWQSILDEHDKNDLIYVRVP